jgi:hypothetical protein
MSARQELAVLLEKWFQLSQAEGAAIQAAAWDQVKNIQADKARLRHSLTEQQQRLPDPNPFPEQIARLISLETRNSELLAAQLRRAHAEKKSLGQAGKNLRRIQSSYARRQSGTRWNCYS